MATRRKRRKPTKLPARATSTRARKKKGSSSDRRRARDFRTGRKIALRVGIVLFLFFVLAYAVTDYGIRATLAHRRLGELPAIYSAPLTVRAGDHLPAEGFLAHLANRHYRQVDGAPKHPGEYMVQPSGEKVVELITRQSRMSDGHIEQPKHVRFSPATGTLRGASSFTLEPEVLAPLTGGSQRADRFVPLTEIPPLVRAAFLATEDQRFYLHFGIDPIGIARAIFSNLTAGGWVQGGSTITQQLAKNLFLSPEKTLLRKAREALAALALERQLTKDQILELYLNEVYLGQEGAVAVHGVAEAANVFFGKRLSEVHLGEAAMLAGLVRAPSIYSPRRHLTRAQKRKEVVLSIMRDAGMVREEEFQRGLTAKIKIVEERYHHRRGEFFVTALRQEINSEVNLDTAALSGVSVYTGIRAELQGCGEQALRNGLGTIEKNHPALRKRRAPLEGGLVAISPADGLVRAWVGGRDYRNNQFDHVALARRPIGSTIKPFLYLTALDGALNTYKVATPISILPDRPLQIELPAHASWEPENFDREYRGDVTLRYALEHSLNLPAVYVAQKVSVEALRRTLRDFRVVRNPPAVPALALGAAETTLFDLTNAYGALSNGGVYVAPRLFESILDGEGGTVAQSSPFQERVAHAPPSYVLLDMLRGVIERGTGQGIRRSGYRAPAAGKTGTSNESRDAWFVGFTPELVAGVWVGFDDNSKTGLTGGGAAAPIWAEFMKCADSLTPRASEGSPEFVPPPGVVFVKIDGASGARATPDCPLEQVTTEVFVRETEPLHFCPLHLPAPPVRDEKQERDLVGPSKRRDRPAEPGFWERIFGVT